MWSDERPSSDISENIAIIFERLSDQLTRCNQQLLVIVSFIQRLQKDNSDSLEIVACTVSKNEIWKQPPTSMG
jgi:hypothetical protein